MSRSLFQHAAGGVLERRWIGWVLAALLIASSIALGLQREHAISADQARQADVQANILAASVGGALAFDDKSTMEEYLNALGLDQDILAAGIYNDQGALVAGFSKDGGALPRSVRIHPPRIAGFQLSVVRQVRQEDLLLGSVYLRTSIEPLSARLTRYGGIGIVVIMAALLIAILGASNAKAKATNRELQDQIVARERAETALRQAQKLEALGQLTGGVAHDFNNLLMAASSGLELMERTSNPERQGQLKKGVRDALDHGARLTHHLLAFSRQSPVQTEVISVADRIDQLAELLHHSLRENISVSFDIPGDVWPIEVDASQFDIAVLNIAVNARDAMPTGGEIVISARNLAAGLDGKDAVQLRIEDEGTGMSAEAAEKAFEPFFTLKDVGQGTGLGLSQVYGFTRSAGGSAAIASELGAGTIVTLTFPRSAPAPAATATEPVQAPAVRIDHKCVLLVEDDASLSDFVGQMLEELGSTVIRARSAQAGLRAFAGARVDLAISDMVMPGSMDGLALARRLREKDDRLPIVLMTGYSAAAADAAAEGFVVLRKPFTFETLAAQLSSAIEAARVEL